MSRRLFVALPPNEAAIAHLQHHLAIIGPPEGRARPTVPAGWHITMVFLGEVADEDADDVNDGLAEALNGFEPFPLALAGGGAFGPPEAAKSWWAGVHDPTGTLPEINRVCLRAAKVAGIRVAAENFFPHLTLFRGHPRPSPRWLRSWDDYRGPDWTVNAVHLMESVLQPSGSHYRTLVTHPLNCWAT